MCGDVGPKPTATCEAGAPGPTELLYITGYMQMPPPSFGVRGGRAGPGTALLSLPVSLAVRGPARGWPRGACRPIAVARVRQEAPRAGSSDIVKPQIGCCTLKKKPATFDCEASATLGSKLYPAWPDCERDLRWPHAGRGPRGHPQLLFITWLKLDPKLQQACWWKPTLTE